LHCYLTPWRQREKTHKTSKIAGKCILCLGGKEIRISKNDFFLSENDFFLSRKYLRLSRNRKTPTGFYINGQICYKQETPTGFLCLLIFSYKRKIPTGFNCSLIFSYKRRTHDGVSMLLRIQHSKFNIKFALICFLFFAICYLH
jgi:hypothetical protein